MCILPFVVRIPIPALPTIDNNINSDSQLFIFPFLIMSRVGSACDSRGIGSGSDTRYGHILSFLLPLVQEVSYWRKYVHEVLVNRLCGLSLLKNRF